MDSYDGVIDYFEDKANVEVVESSAEDILEHALEEEARNAYQVRCSRKRLSFRG